MPHFMQQVAPFWYLHKNIRYPQNSPVFATSWQVDNNGVQMAGSLIKETIKYQKVLYSPLKKNGFVPEAGSEVFVKNIPKSAIVEDLMKFFGRIGDIFQIRLMMEPDSDTNRGFAYVTFMNSTLANKAVSYLPNERFLGYHFLSMESSLNNCRIFMGGLPVNKSKDEVWQELHRNGIENITDVIMYRSYSNRAENRGFVFIEFKTHEEAAHFRAKYGKTLRLWGLTVIIDWSVPIPEIDSSILENVKILYLRNLNVWESPTDFETQLSKFIRRDRLEKVYKFKNYAFIHVVTRSEAEILKARLEEFYKGTYIEISWSKPPNRYTTQEYRQKKVCNISRQSRSRTSSSSGQSSSYSRTSSPMLLTPPSPQPSTSQEVLYTHKEVQGIVASVLNAKSTCPPTRLSTPGLSTSNAVDDICQRLVPLNLGQLPYGNPSSSSTTEELEYLQHLKLMNFIGNIL